MRSDSNLRTRDVDPKILGKKHVNSSRIPKEKANTIFSLRRPSHSDGTLPATQMNLLGRTFLKVTIAAAGHIGRAE